MNRKILFISATLGGGGAERVMSYVLNSVANEPNYKAVLLLLKNSDRNYLNTLSDKIDIVRLNLKGRIRNHIFRIIAEIIRQRPQICFVGLDSFNRLFAPFIPLLNLFGIKVIARETNVLSMHYGNNKYLKLYYKYFYNLYDSIIAQSKDMAEDLQFNWHIRKDKISLIHNPIDIGKIEILGKELQSNHFDNTKFNFIAIGRLSKQKGFDILIERLSNFDTSNIRLYIVGDGNERDILESLIAKYKLQNTVFLLGYQANPYKYIKMADAFILSSRYEGFPNVLLEACCLGKPVFCNLCKGGINEIVTNVNGMTADFNSQDDFNEKLKVFLSTEFDGDRISSDIKQRYCLENIMPAYSEVFNSLQ